MFRALLLVVVLAGCKDKAAEAPAKTEARAPAADPSPAARKGEAPVAEAKPAGETKAPPASEAMRTQARIREVVQKVGVKSDKAELAKLRKREVTTPTNHVENKPAQP